MSVVGKFGVWSVVSRLIRESGGSSALDGTKAAHTQPESKNILGGKIETLSEAVIPSSVHMPKSIWSHRRPHRPGPGRDIVSTGIRREQGARCLHSGKAVTYTIE